MILPMVGSQCYIRVLEYTTTRHSMLIPLRFHPRERWPLDCSYTYTGRRVMPPRLPRRLLALTNAGRRMMPRWPTWGTSWIRMGATWTMHEPLWQHGAAWVTSYGKGTTYGKGATNGNLAHHGVTWEQHETRRCHDGPRGTPLGSAWEPHGRCMSQSGNMGPHE